MSASTTSNPPVERGMDAARKIKVLNEVLKQFGSGQKVDPADWQDFVRAQNDELKTGPKVGESVPPFQLGDQNSKRWTTSELMGPNGFLLVFIRSAVW
jgi:hypothetical protein